MLRYAAGLAVWFLGGAAVWVGLGITAWLLVSMPIRDMDSRIVSARSKGVSAAEFLVSELREAELKERFWRDMTWWALAGGLIGLGSGLAIQRTRYRSNWHDQE